LPIQPGHVERQEFEYQRHGTQSLIANLDVATGQVVTPSMGPTRDLCRLCHSHHADPPDRSSGRLDLHHRSAQHSPIRNPGPSRAVPTQLSVDTRTANPGSGLYCLLQSHVQRGLSTSPTKGHPLAPRLPRYFRVAVLVLRSSWVCIKP
jgi:hypothetical protein